MKSPFIKVFNAWQLLHRNSNKISCNIQFPNINIIEWFNKHLGNLIWEKLVSRYQYQTFYLNSNNSLEKIKWNVGPKKNEFNTPRTFDRIKYF